MSTPHVTNPATRGDGPDSAATDESGPPPLLVGVNQAAKMLAISRTTLYQLIWSDEVVPIRVGRSVRFSIAQLEDFVARRTTTRD